MAAALATLPWVERTSLVADRRIRQVWFTVTDPARYDLAAIREAVRRAGYGRADQLRPPRP